MSGALIVVIVLWSSLVVAWWAYDIGYSRGKSHGFDVGRVLGKMEGMEE